MEWHVLGTEWKEPSTNLYLPKVFLRVEGMLKTFSGVGIIITGGKALPCM